MGGKGGWPASSGVANWLTVLQAANKMDGFFGQGNKWIRGEKRGKKKGKGRWKEGRVMSVSGKRNGRRGKKLERESRRGGREKLVGERMWVGGVSGRREERGKRKKKRKDIYIYIYIYKTKIKQNNKN